MLPTKPYSIKLYDKETKSRTSRLSYENDMLNIQSTDPIFINNILKLYNETGNIDDIGDTIKKLQSDIVQLTLQMDALTNNRVIAGSLTVTT